MVTFTISLNEFMGFVYFWLYILVNVLLFNTFLKKIGQEKHFFGLVDFKYFMMFFLFGIFHFFFLKKIRKIYRIKILELDLEKWMVGGVSWSPTTQEKIKMLKREILLLKLTR